MTATDRASSGARRTIRHRHEATASTKIAPNVPSTIDAVCTMSLDNVIAIAWFVTRVSGQDNPPPIAYAASRQAIESGPRAY